MLWELLGIHSKTGQDSYLIIHDMPFPLKKEQLTPEAVFTVPWGSTLKHCCWAPISGFLISTLG